MTFNAELFDELASAPPPSREPGGKVDGILSDLPERDRDVLLKYLNNPLIGAKRLSRIAKRSGLDLGSAAISGWREVRNVE